MARFLIISGILLLLAGLLLWLYPNAFRLLGKLPGDFHFRSGNVEFYFPLTTGLIISLLLSMLFRMLR